MKIYEKVTDWLVPLLLSGSCYFLWGIQGEIKRLSETLAVIVFRIDDQEKRLDRLERRCEMQWQRLKRELLEDK